MDSNGNAYTCILLSVESLFLERYNLITAGVCAYKLSNVHHYKKNLNHRITRVFCFQHREKETEQTQ